MNLFSRQFEVNFKKMKRSVNFILVFLLFATEACSKSQPIKIVESFKQKRRIEVAKIKTRKNQYELKRFSSDKLLQDFDYYNYHDIEEIFNHLKHVRTVLNSI